MMKNHLLLKNSLECLKQIREELHNDLDSGTREKLDKVINDLESSDSGLTSDQLLETLSKGIEFIPVIARVIKAFMEL